MTPTAPDRPTRARLVLALWLCGLAGVLYLDRICMAQAVVPIQSDLGLSNTDISYATMAFTLAYGLFEIPTGRLGDRFGSRRVLVRIVLWWSAFTALTGACSGLGMLVVVRFLFGAGEAGAFPNAARVISRWFPPGERGRMQGIMFTAAQLGATIAPVLAAELIARAGWRWSFAAFGVVGVVWAIGFWFWFRDDPAAHPRVNAAELAVIHDGAGPPPPAPASIPWKVILRNRGVLVLGVIQIIGSFFTYFFYTWFPKYLTAAWDLDERSAGRLASFVLAGSMVGVFLGGFLADRITTRSAAPNRSRRFLGVGCYLTAAACLFGGVRSADPVALAGLFCAAFCLMHLTLPNWWTCAIAQGGRHVGTVCGLMNGVGVLGAMASQGFVGVFADRQKELGLSGRPQWDPVFDVYVGVLIAGAVAWSFFRITPLEGGEDLRLKI